MPENGCIVLMLSDLWWELLLLWMRDSEVTGKTSRLLSHRTGWSWTTLINNSASISTYSIVIGEQYCADQRSGGKLNNVAVGMAKGQQM